MLRRVFALVLAFTCAFAPAELAWAAIDAGADACCCGSKCACPPTDCAPPPSAPVAAAPAAAAALEQRAATARPRARVVAAVFSHLAFARPAGPVLLRVRPSDSTASAASVALFQAHCSLLI